jgi:coenzyme F420-reducing hydrogenase delta subunit/Pyruvate/2-oxoacid:ferredoxin oxidoreductase delta subunit
VRCREGLGVWGLAEELPLSSWAWEFVNLREHCTWVHEADDGLAAAGDLLEAAAARLSAGPSVPLVAAVDPERCRTCGTCQVLCRAGTIRLETDEAGRVRTMVDVSRCLTCGTCAAHCPTGAIVAGRITDRQVEATVQALLGREKDGRLLVFTCNWGGHSGAEAAGMERLQLPAGVRVVRLPCLGRLSPGLLLRALEQGAAGVLLLGCPEDACDYDFGRDLAGEALAQAQALARMVGVNPDRMGLIGLGLGDGEAFARELRNFAEVVRALPGTVASNK